MQKNESGRSMVEMLGVLAIMGLLAMTGLKGFSMMMDKIEANRISELIGELSTVAQTRNRCLHLQAEEDGSDNFADVLDNDEARKPKCITSLHAAKNGQVKVVFSNDCDSVIRLVGDSFGECRWVKLDSDYFFMPTRNRMCAEYNHETGKCEKWGTWVAVRNDEGEVTGREVVNPKKYDSNNPCEQVNKDSVAECIR